MLQTDKLEWRRVGLMEQEEGPVARGWTQVAVVGSGKRASVAVVGGLNDGNERLGDAWSIPLKDL